jgi:uncharacterized membrane protein
MLKRAIAITCVCLGTALAGTTAANAGNATSEAHAKNLAAKQCTAEKKADKGAFQALYGDHAMRRCIKGETPEIQQELKNAAKECRAEREADVDAFRDTYGANESGRNAFGKCVSSKVKEEIEEEVAEFKNAAKECRSEREADADAFRETYGQNPNGRNAFGKCVSSKTKEGDDGDNGDEGSE